MPRNMSRLKPVQSYKHVIDTNGAISGPSPSVNDILVTVDNPISNVNQVAIGSTVFGVFLNVQVIQEIPAGGIDNIYMIVFKDVGGALLQPDVDKVGTSSLRRLVIHQEMIMTGTVLTAASAIPKTLFKGFLKFPRTFRRNGIADKMQVVIGHRSGEVTQGTNFCLQCIYKEFR